MLRKMIRLILAVSEDNFIADVDGNLPWYIPHDLKWFKMNTFGKTVVMGSTTWDALPFKLPGRTNRVLTRHRKGHRYINNVPDVKKYSEENEVWVIGGATTALQFYDRGNYFYLTKVFCKVEEGTKIVLPEMKELWASKIFEQNGFSFQFTINIIL